MYRDEHGIVDAEDRALRRALRRTERDLIEARAHGHDADATRLNERAGTLHAAAVERGLLGRGGSAKDDNPEVSGNGE